MKRLLLFVLGLAGLAGCEDGYSPLVKYGVRTDPILVTTGNNLGDERYDPDPPGQLPLLTMKDLDDERNPLFERRAKLLEQGFYRDPTVLQTTLRDKLEAALDRLFGTPADPKVGELSDEERKTLKLEDGDLRAGSQLYRIHCVHCHGVAGDGRGPTARWVNPHPRDFRPGKFKFQSVDQAGGSASPPRRADLLRTLEFGLEGSAMPAFTLLTPNEREQLVSYVIHLTLRGQDEYQTFKDGLEYDAKTHAWSENEDTKVADFVATIHKYNVTKWHDAQDPAKVIPVAPYPFKDDGSKDAVEQLKASVHRGQQLFTGVAQEDATPEFKKLVEKAKCVSCHTNYGRQAQFRWDDWGTLVRPNNFTQGVFRGGRRPVDFYYRIHSGINGSGMTPFGATLAPDSIWDLVNFVRMLSYPQMRQSLKVQI